MWGAQQLSQTHQSSMWWISGQLIHGNITSSVTRLDVIFHWRNAGSAARVVSKYTTLIILATYVIR